MGNSYILGISAYYHDSAAALIRDGEIIAAVQEERFTRKRHDARFPKESIAYCLKEAGISAAELSAVVFYDKPLLKFERLLETYYSFAPSGFLSFVQSMPVWVKEKLFLKSALKKELRQFLPKGEKLPVLWFTEHHQSHAASAFFPSPFESAAVLCLDGVGEWATSSAWVGKGNTLEPLWEIKFPHSLGLLYSAFTYYCGFKVNSGEYKLMGLAPYGEPKYVQLIKNKLIDIKSDGSFRLDLSYFDYMTGLRMTNRRFHELFGGPPRKPESKITQKEMDLARSIQVVTEEIILGLARSLQAETGERNLCLAGGVALNCVANGRLLREKIFERVWVQPAAGDAGGAVGAAYAGWHQFAGAPRSTDGRDRMHASLLGPHYTTDESANELTAKGAVFTKLPTGELLDKVSQILADGKVVGWFQGRMEYGPRALGARSILADPRDPEMQSKLNLKIKHREEFRPFAPAVLEESTAEYFALDCPSPYMEFVAPVKQKLPAITHVDQSARIQTVAASNNPRFYLLLDKFKARTGCGVLVNTSFNVRGEPIVCTPADAYRCFMRTDIDYLVVEDLLLEKSAQPALPPGAQEEFEPD